MFNACLSCISGDNVAGTLLWGNLSHRYRDQLVLMLNSSRNGLYRNRNLNVLVSTLTGYIQSIYLPLVRVLYVYFLDWYSVHVAGMRYELSLCALNCIYVDSYFCHLIYKHRIKDTISCRYIHVYTQ